jgi:flagellar biosynthesis/type III secretory pathway protein FliH
MSGIIKSGNLAGLGAVRPLGSLSPDAVILSKRDGEHDRLRRRIAALEKDVREQGATIADLHDEVERALETGRAEGREAGLAEAQDMQTERLALLETAMCDAQAALAGGLSSLDRLSALLARECVDIILGHADDRAEFVRRIVETQVEKIDKAMLIGIALSRQDFPDDEALAALTARTGLSGVRVTASSDMGSGGCVMSLRLGSVDVGIDRQWSVLREVLGEMASPEATP